MKILILPCFIQPVNRMKKPNVIFYWAKQDQYYIKTSEYFRDYTFKLTLGKHVHFKLVEADTEKDNQKALGDVEKKFSLCICDPPFRIAQRALYAF